MKNIIVAGGCFWGVEEYYRRLKGIINTKTGYTDGSTENPSYEDVCNSEADHVEAVYLEYDENVITLNMILDHLFRMIDPTSLNKQGGDIGIQYRTGVYYQSDEDHKVINDFILEMSHHYKKPIVVDVKKATKFYNAEEYHQDYLVKNPTGYCHVDFSKIKKEELK